MVDVTNEASLLGKVRNFFKPGVVKKVNAIVDKTITKLGGKILMSPQSVGSPDGEMWTDGEYQVKVPVGRDPYAFQLRGLRALKRALRGGDIIKNPHRFAANFGSTQVNVDAATGSDEGTVHFGVAISSKNPEDDEQY